MFNPYSQAWSNTNSSNTNNGQPSIFGALPFPSPESLPTFFTFRFTSFNPTIMNSVVVGPQSRPYFRVISDAPILGVTVLQNSNGRNIALVQWHRHPEVEVRNVFSRQRSSQMLPLSSNQSSRTMTINGETYNFTPQENFIGLYSSTEMLGRVSRSEGSVTLELTGEAIRLGLLEPSITAVFLLQCGRNID
ncbi:hypothetical protein B0H10DRAFT_1831015 [Mycena sp. CBHHK59/15]|nr:hypothetical protein B0H10DRAFT_1831015 [Mycena sp. CBHHK59/15]